MELTLHRGKCFLDEGPLIRERDLFGCRACRKVWGPPRPPQGNPKAEVILVSRNPDPRERDHLGVEEEMLRVMGIPQEEVYRTYSVFCSTPGNRIPFQLELVKCSSWKAWEMRMLSNAKFVITLGVDATRQFLGLKTPTTNKTFWEVHQVSLGGRDLFVFPCHHPRYALQNSDGLPPLAEWCQAVGEFIRERRS